MFAPSLEEEVDLVAEDEAVMVDIPVAEVDAVTWAAVVEEVEEVVEEDLGEGAEEEDAVEDAKYNAIFFKLLFYLAMSRDFALEIPLLISFRRRGYTCQTLSLQRQVW